ncbi:hypothetical protein PHMEG_00030366 [Phytophthora megakarya]|uniref:RxLR effector protein n=1 Tax=Phytophthora megakarya TaxID=4795 RepID=A0A225V0G1_9STRA|nr:hypothetical protein PHMEG_00030366 [Phytophthora megakarya]
MRVSQVLLVNVLALLAWNINITTAIDAVAMDNSKTSPPTADGFEQFVQEVPFKYGNVTGTMIITIDPDSLRELSEDELSSPASLKAFDFTLLNVAGAEDEERALFGSQFVEILMMFFDYRMWGKLMNYSRKYGKGWFTT